MAKKKSGGRAGKGKAKSTTSSKRKTAAKRTTGGSKRKAGGAFMKPLTPSAQLSEVVGTKALPRTEVVKKLWAYIKRHGLQDSKNRRMINADDRLKPIFSGKKQVNMFEMTKYVSKHLS